MSRSLNDLHPEMRERVEKSVQDWEAAGLDILITCCWRSHAEQQALYEQGRTTPGKIVTRAKPGQSAHNFTIGGKPASLAVDIVPIEFGKPCWNEKSPLWARAGAIAKANGLDWYGDPGSPFFELPHFQMKGAMELIRA